MMFPEDIMEMDPISRLKSSFVGQSVDLGYLFESQGIQSDDDVQFLFSLFDLFLTASPTQLQNITQAIADKNSEKLKTTLHHWKSSIANVGALKLSGLCSTLESQLHQTTKIDWSSVEKLSQELESEYQHAIQDILNLKDLQKTSLTKTNQ